MLYKIGKEVMEIFSDKGESIVETEQLEIPPLSSGYKYNRETRCCKAKCLERVTYACNCTVPAVYCCDRHLIEHSRTIGKHANEYLMIPLTEDQKSKLLPILLEMNICLQGYEHDILEHSREIIECISTETSKSLKNIQEYQNIIAELINADEISKISYGTISNLKDCSLGIEKIKKIKNKIKNLFEFNQTKWKECDEAIFSRGTKNGNISSIDLQTFKLSNLNFAPKVGSACQITKISKCTYFFHGGWPAPSLGKAFLIDIKRRKYQSLADGPLKFSGASAFKDDKVYIFGGASIGKNALNTCTTYEVVQREWKSISLLPMPCHQMTAAVVGNVIILSGIQMSCCYSYNDVAFVNVLRLPAHISKVVCEGWILCKSILYENQGEDITNWIAYEIDNNWNNDLLVYTTFRKNKYFYFIDAANSLMRIDTKRKILERIKLS